MNEFKDNYNPPDGRGVHRYRFKWKDIIDTPKNKIKNIWMKIENNVPKYYFELDIEDTNFLALNEIINVRILKKIEENSKDFKVIGARGRNIIIGEINLEEFDISGGNILILTSLMEWREYIKKRR